MVTKVCMLTYRIVRLAKGDKQFWKRGIDRQHAADEEDGITEGTRWSVARKALPPPMRSLVKRDWDFWLHALYIFVLPLYSILLFNKYMASNEI